MTRNFALAWLIVFVVWMLGSFIIHGLILTDAYHSLPELFRSDEDAQPLFPLMLAAHVLMAGALVWIYRQGRTPDAWMPQGLRFGAAVACLTTIPNYTIYFVVQPMPASLSLHQGAMDAVLMLVIGMVVAFLHKD